MLAIDGDGVTNIVLERECTNDTASPKSAENSNFLCMYCHLVKLMFVGVMPYTAIVLINAAIHAKLRLITKDDFQVKIGPLPNAPKIQLITVYQLDLRVCRPKF